MAWIDLPVIIDDEVTSSQLNEINTGIYERGGLDSSILSDDELNSTILNTFRSRVEALIGDFWDLTRKIPYTKENLFTDALVGDGTDWTRLPSRLGPVSYGSLQLDDLICVEHINEMKQALDKLKYKYQVIGISNGYGKFYGNVFTASFDDSKNNVLFNFNLQIYAHIGFGIAVAEGLRHDHEHVDESNSYSKFSKENYFNTYASTIPISAISLSGIKYFYNFTLKTTGYWYTLIGGVTTIVAISPALQNLKIFQCVADDGFDGTEIADISSVDATIDGYANCSIVPGGDNLYLKIRYNPDDDYSVINSYGDVLPPYPPYQREESIESLLGGSYMPFTTVCTINQSYLVLEYAFTKLA